MTCQVEKAHLSHNYTITQTYLCPGVGEGIVNHMTGEELDAFAKERRAIIKDLKEQLDAERFQLHRVMDEVRRRAAQFGRGA